jgi:suppressor for copper-sensitivity B
VAAAAVLAALVAPRLAPEPPEMRGAEAWAAFDRGAIAAEVAAGRVVFVDVTADWCLTCKANERLVLARGEVAAALASDGVRPMRADWTRPDETIRRYLEENGRFGIPYYAAYGPGAPDGLSLPEVLTPGLVLDALAEAAGETVATAD